MRITNRYKDKEKYHRFIEKDVISLFLKNNNIYQTAKLFKISYQVINRILDINGYNHPKRSEWRLGTSKLLDKKEEIISLYIKGIPAKDIGKQYGTYHSIVTKLLKDAGIPLRTRSIIQQSNYKLYGKIGCIKKNPKLEELKDIIIELYLLKQKTVWDIGDILGLGHTSILRHLYKWKIPLRQSPNYKMYLCDDGHKVRSSYELKVDNWLYHNGILHATNEKINKYYFDFKVGEYYIEIWGMIEKEDYKQKMIKKLDFYDVNHLKIISLFPKDNFQEKLAFLISLYSKEQKILGEYNEK